MALLAGKVPPERIDEMFAEGRYVDDDGIALAVDAAYQPGLRLWFHRDLPDEPPVPFRAEVLYRDDRIVVVDKPHFLATIPRGQHIRQTVVVQLRRELNLPDLVPAHRLDRATAGVLLLTTDRRYRGTYQNLFRDRLVHKEYRAVAGVRPDLALPTTVTSHIVKERGVLRAYDVPGAAPNARTRVELIDASAGRGLYRLLPETGKTHQLRLHLAGLGIPIVNDPFYPDLLDVPRDDFTRPLQLLAHTLRFTDPVDGEVRELVSRQRLRWAPR